MPRKLDLHVWEIQLYVWEGYQNGHFTCGKNTIRCVPKYHNAWEYSLYVWEGSLYLWESHHYLWEGYHVVGDLCGYRTLLFCYLWEDYHTGISEEGDLIHY